MIIVWLQHLLNKLTFWENENGQFGFIVYMVTQSVLKQVEQS